MSAQLSARERLLATAVGIVVFALLNIFVISYFMKNQRRLRGELNTRALQLDAMKSLFANREISSQRDAWLKEKQPPLKNEAKAGSEFLEEIKEIAKKANVQPLSPQVGAIQRHPQYVGVSVNIEAKGPAAAIRDFLYEMQAPDRFVVFQSANLQIDQEDKTQIRGKFRVEKWFAPK